MDAALSNGSIRTDVIGGRKWLLEEFFVLRGCGPGMLFVLYVTICQNKVASGDEEASRDEEASGDEEASRDEEASGHD